MLVEQAIFASARNGHAEGYHLVERTCGLAESDARELTQWGPSHDSLADSGPEAVSYNFFGLESGAYCVSKTIAAGAEYSGRGGAQVQTQCLVVPAAVLARFSNNPFAVLRAAASDDLYAGAANGDQEPAARRAPLRLVGRAAAVDHMLLAQLALAPGPEAMAALVQCVLSSRRLVVVCPNGDRLLAGLISCLPLERRLGISLSTGLKLSPRRPFRVSTAPADSPELRRQARALDAEVILLDQIGQIAVAADSWPGAVEVALRESRFSQLAAEIVRRGTPVPVAIDSVGHPAQSELAEIPWDSLAADEAVGSDRRIDSSSRPGADQQPAVWAVGRFAPAIRAKPTVGRRPGVHSSAGTRPRARRPRSTGARRKTGRSGFRRDRRQAGRLQPVSRILAGGTGASGSSRPRRGTRAIPAPRAGRLDTKRPSGHSKRGALSRCARRAVPVVSRLCVDALAGPSPPSQITLRRVRHRDQRSAHHDGVFDHQPTRAAQVRESVHCIA